MLLCNHLFIYVVMIIMKIGSHSRSITASLLAKRLSFLATGSCLYAMGSLCIDNPRGSDEQRANLVPEISPQHEKAADQHGVAQ